MTAEVYNCHACPAKFKSLKDLTAHYEKEHPDMIEELIMPI
jgi:uncharacterized C2H2 Zn-finger protein